MKPKQPLVSGQKLTWARPDPRTELGGGGLEVDSKRLGSDSRSPSVFLSSWKATAQPLCLSATGYWPVTHWFCSRHRLTLGWLCRLCCLHRTPIKVSELRRLTAETWEMKKRKTFSIIWSNFGYESLKSNV